jgi:hypothetical protein
MKFITLPSLREYIIVEIPTDSSELRPRNCFFSEAMEGKARHPIPVPKGQAIRTRLYVRVVEQFPEGWMTTGLLSRESELPRRSGRCALTDAFNRYQ